MKLVLLIYLLLGIAISAILKDASMRLGPFECLFLAALHIPFIGLGFAVARSSKPTNDGYTRGMSPFGWGAAMIASYFIGFIAFIVARRWG